MNEVETINNFMKQLPDIVNAFSSVKKLYKKDVVKENGLDKKEDMSGMTIEEKREFLEKKYENYKKFKKTSRRTLSVENNILNQWIKWKKWLMNLTFFLKILKWLKKLMLAMKTMWT